MPDDKKEPKIIAKVEEKDGGYYFPELDLHVVANGEAEARQHVIDHHGFDPNERVAEIKEAEKVAQENEALTAKEAKAEKERVKAAEKDK